jgi:hypothetical protein
VRRGRSFAQASEAVGCAGFPPIVGLAAAAASAGEPAAGAGCGLVAAACLALAYRGSRRPR